MVLTYEQQRDVAALVGHPGYQVLLGVLREKETELLQALSTQGNDTVALQQLRWWQLVHRFTQILTDTPASVRAELDRLTEEGNLTDEDLRNRPDAWFSRFGNPNPKPMDNLTSLDDWRALTEKALQPNDSPVVD